ncbi:MAG: HAMP domain-containing histidine kinase [Deltaproteobacteria bacterium]|nr:HAMP domain-containing histidine kinase [Deltaproteobacteria bacterium]
MGIYGKLLLSFLGMLLMVQLLVMGSFLIEGPPSPRRTLDPHLKALTLFAQKLARQGLARGLAQGKPQDEVLSGLSREIADITGGRVWFQVDGMARAFSPGTLPPPGLLERAEARGDRQGPFLSLWEPPREMLIAVPLEAPALPGARLCLLLVHPPERPPPHYPFLLRLGFICLLVSLLIIPLARRISRPLKELDRSAMLIAEGNLDHQAQVSARGEIGELAQAFNLMTSRLRQMILAGRELLAHVSHELRSPLTRIYVASQLLSESLPEEAAPRAQGYLADIREEIDRLDGLLARILLLSRLDLLSQPLPREPVDLAELLRQQTDLCGPLLTYRDLQLRLDLPDQAWVLGDGESLASAFSNLLDNAAKHSPAPAEITLRLTRRGEHWRVVLANPSPPLSPDDLTAMFTPFHSLPGAENPGSGLGLTLCQKIITAHQGAIRAEYRESQLAMVVELPVGTGGEKGS